MKKIKILVVTSSFPRKKNDWWAQFILNIYKQMPKEKYDITIIAPHAPSAKRVERMYGMKVIRFPYFIPFRLQRLTTGEGIVHSSKKGILNRFQIITFVMSQFLFTVFYLIKHKTDILHAHWVIPQGITAVIAKKVFKKPTIITVHGTDIFGLRKLDFLKSFVLNNSDICTVNSRATFQAVKNLSSKVRTEIIHMGIDLEVFSKHKFDKRWKREIGGNYPLLLGVGRLIRCKGFEYLIKAMPAILVRYPKAKLLIVGSGPKEQKLQTIAEKLHLLEEGKIVFTGNMLHDRLARIYASCDVFLAPSIKDSVTGETEGQNVSILEAMASGLSVIASKSGGMVDIVDGKTTGLLIKGKSVEDITDKVLYLLAHKNEKEKMKKKALLIARKNFSWTIISKKFTSLYDQMIGGTK